LPPRSAAPASNFGFLSDHDPLLLRLCVGAERNYHDDPNTTVIKLRQFGEAVVKHLAAVFDITAYAEQSQAELLKTLQIRRLIDRNVADLLHFLRKEGNLAAHQFETTPAQAKSALKIARELALWFHRSFGTVEQRSFKAGAFQEPVAVDLQARLAEMSSALQLKVAEARAAYDVAEAERQRRVDAESRAHANAEEKALWEQLAQEEEQERLRLTRSFEARLAAIHRRRQRSAAPPNRQPSRRRSPVHRRRSRSMRRKRARSSTPSSLLPDGWQTAKP
jgi:type I restriction enzyme R subunit